MSVKLNLGAWNTIFAVPSKIVDEGLKFSDGVKLKVLLYVLRHTERQLTDEEISEGTGVNVTDVPEALDYWVSFGVLDKTQNDYVLAEKSDSEIQNFIPEIEQVTAFENNSEVENNSNNNNVVNSEYSVYRADVQQKNENLSNEPSTEDNSVDLPKQKFSVSRPKRPDYVFTAQRLAVDEELKILVNEAQITLGKTLGNSDISALLMLKDTCGLPLDVIFMLMHYCVSINKPNIHAIEKIGIEWANDGIYSLEAAENKIASVQQTSKNFSIVSSAFGLKNVGSPTSQQLKYADKWVGEWKFSPEMLREAYERCVDKLGQMKLSYINRILENWHTNNVYNLNDLQAFDKRITAAKTDKKQSSSIDFDKLNEITIPDF